MSVAFHTRFRDPGRFEQVAGLPEVPMSFSGAVYEVFHRYPGGPGFTNDKASLIHPCFLQLPGTTYLISYNAMLILASPEWARRARSTWNWRTYWEEFDGSYSLPGHGAQDLLGSGSCGRGATKYLRGVPDLPMINSRGATVSRVPGTHDIIRSGEISNWNEFQLLFRESYTHMGPVRAKGGICRTTIPQSGITAPIYITEMELINLVNPWIGTMNVRHCQGFWMQGLSPKSYEGIVSETVDHVPPEACRTVASRAGETGERLKYGDVDVLVQHLTQHHYPSHVQAGVTNSVVGCPKTATCVRDSGREHWVETGVWAFEIHTGNRVEVKEKGPDYVVRLGEHPVAIVDHRGSALIVPLQPDMLTVASAVMSDYLTMSDTIPVQTSRFLKIVGGIIRATSPSDGENYDLLSFVFKEHFKPVTGRKLRALVQEYAEPQTPPIGGLVLGTLFVGYKKGAIEPIIHRLVLPSNMEILRSGAIISVEGEEYDPYERRWNECPELVSEDPTMSLMLSGYKVQKRAVRARIVDYPADRLMDRGMNGVPVAMVRRDDMVSRRQAKMRRTK